MSMLTLFESRCTLKGRYSIGNVEKTASMSMLTLFESRCTLNRRYISGYVRKTASMSKPVLALFESIYTIKVKIQHRECWQNLKMDTKQSTYSKFQLNAESK